MEAAFFDSLSKTHIDRGMGYTTLHGETYNDKKLVLPASYVDGLRLDGTDIPGTDVALMERLRLVGADEFEQACEEYEDSFSEDDLVGMSRERGSEYMNVFLEGYPGLGTIVPQDYKQGWTSLMRYLDILIGSRYFLNEELDPSDIGSSVFSYPVRSGDIELYPLNEDSIGERAFWHWVGGAATPFYKMHGSTSDTYDVAEHLGSGADETVKVRAHTIDRWRQLGNDGIITEEDFLKIGIQ